MSENVQDLSVGNVSRQPVADETTYGFDRNGDFWAIDSDGQSTSIERSAIPDGEPIKDFDGFFREPGNDSDSDNDSADAPADTP